MRQQQIIQDQENELKKPTQVKARPLPYHFRKGFEVHP